MNKDNVLVIGDTHFPFVREGYLRFCKDIQRKYNCGTVVHIGDVVDNHAISRFPSDPDGWSGGLELNQACQYIQQWGRHFPKMKVCIGNHDERPMRKAFEVGLPKEVIRNLNEIYKTPDGWDWKFEHTIHGVIYQHGTGKSGATAHTRWAKDNRKSTVVGHTHADGGVQFMSSNHDLIFGMNVGCGLDIKSYAMAYGLNYSRRPTIGCGVVLSRGRVPIFVPMNL